MSNIFTTSTLFRNSIFAIFWLCFLEKPKVQLENSSRIITVFSQNKASIILPKMVKNCREKPVHVWHDLTIMILLDSDFVTVGWAWLKFCWCKTAEGGCGCWGNKVAGMGFVVTWKKNKYSWNIIEHWYTYLAFWFGVC